jgi:hypothetical protein
VTGPENHSERSPATGVFFRGSKPDRCPTAARGDGATHHAAAGVVGDGRRAARRIPFSAGGGRLRAGTLLLLCLFGWILAGCASLRGPVADRNEYGAGHERLTAAQIVERLPTWPAALDTLYAEADVQVSSPEEKGRFGARIAYRRADSMLIRVRFPLGIEGARVLVTPDSAFVYDRIEKQVIAGTPESVSAVLPVAVAGTNLVELATGFFDPGDPSRWILVDDSLRIVLERTDGLVRLMIDPERWRVILLQIRTAEGMILEERRYMDFALFNKTVLPRRMTLSRPPEDTRLMMALRKLDPSPGELSFGLDVSSNARRIQLH